MLTTCKLNSYLADIDRQAEEMFSRLVKQLSEKEGVTETLKAENQLLWVQKMNNLRNAAMEIVSNELKADNTGNTHNRSRANVGVNSTVNAASNAGVNNTVRNSSSVNSADFGKTAVTGTNSNRFAHLHRRAGGK